MAKPKSGPKPPSTERLRRWVKRQPFQKPRGLRMEPRQEAGTVVVSFPVPAIDWRELVSKTEADVVEDILGGLSNAQIALKRGTAVRTIANQVASIYRKLGVRSRLELSLYALTGRHTFQKKK